MVQLGGDGGLDHGGCSGEGMTREFGLYLPVQWSGFTDGLGVGHEREESRPNQVTTEKMEGSLLSWGRLKEEGSE